MRVYLEITNVCNRHCSFCAGTKRQKCFVPADIFALRLKKVLPVSSEICLHVMGEPLLHPEIAGILGHCVRMQAPVTLVTNGTLLSGKEKLLLDCTALRQINFSLHALDLRDAQDGERLKNILTFCREALCVRPELFLNLRLWNLGTDFDAEKKNAELLSRIREFFPAAGEEMNFSSGRKSKRVEDRLYLNCDTVFEWPSKRTEELEQKGGFCHGLRDQIAVLADGTVVPCCLDADGCIPLGNLDETELSEILSSPSAATIRKGFEKGIAVHPFCRKCSFRMRFRH